MGLVMVAMAQIAAAEGEIDLKAITSGTYYADNLKSMNPLAGDAFVQIDRSGEKLVKYSFQTGKETGVLFDAGNTKGEKIKAFDDYEMSKDGQWILLATASERIYRHSFTAIYYLYNTVSQELKQLSKNGRQQAPVWSPSMRALQAVFSPET